MFTLSFWEMVVSGVIASVLTYLAGVITTPGFSLSTFHWSILVNFIFVSVVVVIKNMLTNPAGQFVGAVKIRPLSTTTTSSGSKPV